MLAATSICQSVTNPLSGVVLRDVLEPRPTPDWSRVRVVASSLDPNDLCTLRGVGRAPAHLPVVLGCDDGNEVVDRPLTGGPDADGDETLGPNRMLLSEWPDRACAEYLTVSTRFHGAMPAWIARFMTTAKGW